MWAAYHTQPRSAAAAGQAGSGRCPPGDSGGLPSPNRADGAGVVIRPEEPRDWRAINALETAAFPSPAEAFMAIELVGTVRHHPAVGAVA